MAEDFVLKGKTCGFYNFLRSIKESQTFHVRLGFEHNAKTHAPTLGVGKGFKQLATFHECEVSVQFFLEDSLMLEAVGPVEMIAYRQNHVSRLGIHAGDVH